MVPVLEAVPNFSEGRDPAFVRAVVDAALGQGVEVLDHSSDPDHHRSVVTWIGDPPSVEAAALATAEVALERIDLRDHRGVHPRVGALDVLPFVPLSGLGPEDAVASARRVGQGLAEMGIPVYFYGQASDPPGRGLAELRRGGFEALAGGFPAGRRPDLDAGRDAAHPSAGAVCVGARPLLLAWNVWVDGLTLDQVRDVARGIRETGDGFVGMRALGLRLERGDALQISMNVEDVERNRPMELFEEVESAVARAGGSIRATEVIGMIPEGLVLEAAARRLRLLGANSSRFLPARLAGHLASRAARDAGTILSWIEGIGEAVPSDVRAAMERLTGPQRTIRDRVVRIPGSGDDA